MQLDRSTYADKTLAAVDALLARRYPDIAQSTSAAGAHRYSYQSVSVTAFGDVQEPNRVYAYIDGREERPCYIGIPAGAIASDIVAYLAAASAARTTRHQDRTTDDSSA